MKDKCVNGMNKTVKTKSILTPFANGEQTVQTAGAPQKITIL